MTNKCFRYEVFVKQYWHAILDISVSAAVRAETLKFISICIFSKNGMNIVTL